MTIPNLVSLTRIALVPVFLWLVLVEKNPVGGGCLLVLIGSTDWIDGYLARRMNQASKIGEFLDPLADRLAVAAAVFAGLLEGVLPLWLGWPIIVRESLIGGGALFLVMRTGTKLQVRWLGKASTLALYVSVAWFYLSFHDFTLGRVIAYTSGIPGLVGYYTVGFQYFGDLRRELTEGGTVLGSKLSRDR